MAVQGGGLGGAYSICFGLEPGHMVGNLLGARVVRVDGLSIEYQPVFENLKGRTIQIHFKPL